MLMGVEIKPGMAVVFSSPRKSGYLLVTWANDSVVHGYYIVKGDDATYPCIEDFEVVDRKHITAVYASTVVWETLSGAELRSLVFNRKDHRPNKIWEQHPPVELIKELRACKDLLTGIIQTGYTVDDLKERIRSIDVALKDIKQ